MSNVLVVYSGGLDSYTLLNKAIKNFNQVEAITFNYEKLVKFIAKKFYISIMRFANHYYLKKGK